MKELFLITLLLGYCATYAQEESQQNIQVQPQEVVESTPIESFSSKSQGWPVDSVPQSSLDSSGSSLYETLNKYPSIQTQGETSGAPQSIRIRGSGSAARTLLLFDGTPINSMDGTGANPLLLPTEIIDSVDILKGPSSLFYGSDAIGGAINLKPRKFARPTVRLGYESFEKPSLLLGTPILKKEKHTLQGSAYLDDSKGNYEYESTNGEDLYRKDNHNRKQRYSLIGENKFSNTTISHHLIYVREKGKSPGPIPHSTSNVNVFDRNAFLGAAHINQKINALWNANYKISHSRTDNDNAYGGGSETNYFTSKTLHSVSTDYSFSNYSNIEVFTDFSRDDFENSDTNDSKLHDEHFEHGLILRSQISDHEFLLAGIRFFPDQNEVIKNILLKQMRDRYTLWASYTEGIRIPDLTQRYADTSYYVGNPSLKTEKSNQIEVGAETQIQKTKLKISGYTIEYEDFILYDSSVTPNTYNNIQKVSTKGIELQASTDYKIYHWLISYSLMESKNEEDDSNMPLIPHSQVYALVGAQLAAFVFELHNTFWSSYKIKDSQDTDRWWTTDLTMRTSGFNGWNFKAGVLNLLGKEREFTNDYPEPKTQYFVFVEKSF